MAKLKKLGILSREGGRKEGKWVIKKVGNRVKAIRSTDNKN